MINNNHHCIKETNLLVVGAGGLGCELLKCLVMSGLKNISIVDMDTIEKSNLNRQFLFNSASIGKFKSEMAIKAIQTLRQDQSLNLKAYVGNIKNKELFNDTFFKQYDIILNALDNLDTRYYMNLICMRNNIPLVNSGSEGYLGSIGCHLRGLSPCYNCLNKVRKKSIPICSIRLHPEKIEHCVAWGKALFERLFGSETGKNNGNSDYVGNNSLNNDDILNTLQQLFYDDIIALEHKHKLPIDVISIITNGQLNLQNRKDTYAAFISNPSNEDNAKHIIEFLICILHESYELLLQMKPIVFDKENDTIINFIFSSSNLRGENFFIKQESKFKIKEIAGNIIPAISSTNSLVASIQVLECLKIINGQINQCKNVGITKNRKIVSSSSIKEVINPDCLSCSNEMIKRSTLKHINITLDMTRVTLDMFIKKYYEKIYSHNDIDNIAIEVNGNIIYESGNDLDEDELEDYQTLRKKTLSSFHFYEEMQKMNKKIEVLILNLNTNEPIVKYHLHQFNTNLHKENLNQNEFITENNSILGKKRKLSI